MATSLETEALAGKNDGRRLAVATGLAGLALVTGVVALGLGAYATIEVNGMDNTDIAPHTAFVVPAKNYGCEGVTWDTIGQRFIFGSFYTPSIFELIPGSGITGSESAIRPIPEARADNGLGNLGVYLDQKSTRNVLWAAAILNPFTGDPAAAVQASILRVDLTTGLIMEVDVSGLQQDNTRTLNLNDVVTDDDGVAYFSNSFEAQIVRATFNPDLNAVVAESVTLPTSFRPDGQLEFGLNGMEYKDGALFMTYGVTGIWRAPVDAATTALTPTLLLDIPSPDGLRFSSDYSRMFATNGADVLTLMSDNDFQTSAYIAQTYTDVCPPTPGNAPRTVAYVSDDDSLFTMCSDFGPGPYQIVRVF